MSSENTQIRDRIGNNDVTVMRSYLEVDVAEWLSDNEVPFGYEPFVIPSVAGPGKHKWDLMVDAIQLVGGREFDEFDEITEGTMLDDTRPAEVLSMWEDIYDKHNLQEEKVTVEVGASLERFSKRMILPDFTLHLDADMKTAGEDLQWKSYDYIVEVSGLYGVGIPGESDEDEWWDWYRVSGVAFKELAYKLLGLWDDVRWVIPNQGSHGSTSTGIPVELRNDDHYIIMNTTQTGIELDELADDLGITAEPIDQGLSPAITPTKYKRPLDTKSDYPINSVTPVRYTFDSINVAAIDSHENAVLLENGWVVFHGDMGEVYLHSAHAHVRESMWRENNMVMLREYILSSLSELEDYGIIVGLEESG